MSINAFFSVSLSAGCELRSEHGLAGREKHKTVTEMDKSQMSIYSSKLKCLLDKQLDHRMDKRESFIFPRQYRNCFSRRFNALWCSEINQSKGP